ncbi:MAG TPA: hypothetical protein PLM96_06030 [Methanoregulaceae archaeon]|jgi:hypothetical protein|nr:hypothetical protein [Methanolinea sp.]MDD3091462.1 hypothetical protein [Methanoregulaceae archaeon]HOP66366.1 hypothetical protein [Methanoregulaceae archaeon]HPJ74336.1 hypothetical protein [Methanoregulaceae archaeon]HPQ76182.1 hypothetical protein [Methanoregulaceae archaeon]
MKIKLLIFVLLLAIVTPSMAFPWARSPVAYGQWTTPDGGVHPVSYTQNTRDQFGNVYGPALFPDGTPIPNDYACPIHGPACPDDPRNTILYVYPATMGWSLVPASGIHVHVSTYEPPSLSLDDIASRTSQPPVERLTQYSKLNNL